MPLGHKWQGVVRIQTVHPDDSGYSLLLDLVGFSGQLWILCTHVDFSVAFLRVEPVLNGISGSVEKAA